MKKNKKALAIIALAGVVSLGAIVGGTYAYFTDKDSAENVVVMGNVDIELTDELEGQTIEKILPNQKISDAVSIVNVGNNDAFVRLKVSFEGLSAEDILSTFVSNGVENKTETFKTQELANARVAELKEKEIEASVEDKSSETEVIDFFEHKVGERKTNAWFATAKVKCFVPKYTKNADGTTTVQMYGCTSNIYNQGTYMSLSYQGIDWTFAQNGGKVGDSFTLDENERLIILDLSTGKEIDKDTYQSILKQELNISFDTKNEAYGYKWTVVSTVESTDYEVSYTEPVKYNGINSSWTAADTANEDGSIYYYYNGVLKADSESVSILDSLKIPAKWGNSYADKSFKFTIEAEAIQADFVEVEDGVYAEDSKTAFALVDSEGIEIEKYTK